MTDIQVTDMQLLRLYEVATTSRYGMVDRGNPKAYQALESMGLTEKKYDGYIITELGLAVLKLNKNRLFGKKKKDKKPKFDNESPEEYNY